ncbi:hypothetical protein P378_10960 [Desulforamulus profundi]|uniref:Uncharacterized protein n=1 Tax=Desulforamulus profundi TaxID=1383067 RepID=A0A2C6MFY7_9FIRM|nr:hypothetical protein P378_10960 [Desulforamulus profundi]
MGRYRWIMYLVLISMIISIGYVVLGRLLTLA